MGDAPGAEVSRISSSIGTCVAQWRSLFMDGRIANECKQKVRAILACRLQSFFITLRACFPEEAAAILERAEKQATLRDHDRG